MQNKYNLTVEQNIFLVKRNFIDIIYSNARMEALNISLQQIKAILKGVNVPNLKLQIENPTERAIEYMLYGMRSQLFWDSTNDNSKIKHFIYDNCIDGISFEN